MKKFLSNILSRLEHGAITLLLATMILLVFTQIVCRYLHRSISFTEEINQPMFVWVTVLGIAMAVRRKELLGLELLSRTGGALRRKILSLLTLLALLSYAGFMALLSTKMIWTQYSTNKTLPATGWPIWPVGLAILVGFLLVAIRAVQAYWLDERKQRSKQDGKESSSTS